MPFSGNNNASQRVKRKAGSDMDNMNVLYDNIISSHVSPSTVSRSLQFESKKSTCPKTFCNIFTQAEDIPVIFRLYWWKWSKSLQQTLRGNKLMIYRYHHFMSLQYFTMNKIMWRSISYFTHFHSLVCIVACSLSLSLRGLCGADNCFD